VLVGLVQLVPLPAPLLRAISPNTIAFLEQYDLGYALAQPAPAHPISISPRDTAIAIALFVAFATFLVGLSCRLARSGAKHFARAIVWLGLAMALVGIIQKPLFAGKMYGFWETIEDARTPFGPFVNRNHFAGWMVMALGLSFGSFFGSISTAMRGVRPRWRDRVLWLSTPQASRVTLTAMAVLTMTFSLVLTLSRSGIASLAVSLVVAASFLVRERPGRSRRAIGMGYVVVVLLMALGWAGLDAVLARFARVPQQDGFTRMAIWKDTLGIAREFPLLGTGLNTYYAAMLLYQREASANKNFSAAHNDYAQLVSEGGIVLTALLVAALAAFGAAIARRFREGDEEASSWIRAGAVAGLAGIALQELFEFSLQMPGNAALFTVLLAVAVRPSRARRHGDARPSP
jgi:O-antigen ligase